MKNNSICRKLILGLFITVAICIVTQSVIAGNHQNDRTAKVNQLLEIAGTRTPSIPIPEEIRTEKDTDVRKKYFEERNRLLQKEEDKREQARNELATMGDEIIDQLIEIYNNNRYEMHIVIVLKKIGSQKAKETLLNMALGQNSFSSPYSTAARNYLEIVQDKEELKPLLVSNDSDILDVALLGLQGIKVDAQLLKRLEELLQSTQYNPVLNYAMRVKSASIISADTSNELMKEKVFAIVRSFQTIDKLPNANDRMQHDRPGTYADVTYADLTKELIKIKGDKSYLVEASEELTGMSKKWLLAVQAMKGNSSVKSEIKNFLEDPNMVERTLLRSFALKGYKEIADSGDIPFLREIANSDPVVTMDIGGPILETINGKPINNTGEWAVIYDEYSKKEWDRLPISQRRYLIRNNAESAIEAIEKRINSNTEKSQ